MNFITKDSGKRQKFSTGMQRDTNEDKPRFDLISPLGIPYKDQPLTRIAKHMARWAEKYEERNREKACTQEEVNRFRESAYRHFMARWCGEVDEDHYSAVFFNMTGVETTKYKMEHTTLDRQNFSL